MKELELKFVEVDWWGRPIYSVKGMNIYVCSVDVIFPNKEIAPDGSVEQINEYFRNNLDQLVIFGNDLEADPLGTKIKKSITIKIID